MTRETVDWRRIAVQLGRHPSSDWGLLSTRETDLLQAAISEEEARLDISDEVRLERMADAATGLEDR